MFEVASHVNTDNRREFAVNTVEKPVLTEFAVYLLKSCAIVYSRHRAPLRLQISRNPTGKIADLCLDVACHTGQVVDLSGRSRHAVPRVKLVVVRPVAGRTCDGYK